jgi:hypothetical protein
MNLDIITVRKVELEKMKEELAKKQREKDRAKLELELLKKSNQQKSFIFI